MSPTAPKPDRRVTLIFWAVTLIGGGVWLLLINYNLLERFEPAAQYVLVGVLAALGVGFFIAFLSRREKWWRLIPGWLLLTLAAMALLSTRTVIAGESDGRLIAAVLFWGLAIAFCHVFLLRRTLYWWAIIPSGFMFVLGCVVVASIYITRMETLGALLSIGMGLVFVLVYLAARADQDWWPLMPATVLILFGIAAYTAGSGIQNVLLNAWPALLILCGVYLARLAWQPRSARATAGSMEVHSSGALSSPRAAPPTTKLEERRPASPNTTAGNDVDDVEGVLGAYTGPAPGASIDVLSEEPDDHTPDSATPPTRRIR